MNASYPTQEEATQAKRALNRAGYQVEIIHDPGEPHTEFDGMSFIGGTNPYWNIKVTPAATMGTWSDHVVSAYLNRDLTNLAKIWATGETDCKKATQSLFFAILEGKRYPQPQPDENIIPLLGLALESNETKVRSSAVLILYQFGEAARHMEPVFQRLSSHDPDPIIKRMAQNACDQLKGCASESA